MLTKQNGIGLLELMLALAIIAMMMVAASRYYKSTQTARKIHVAVESMQALYSASERCVQDLGKYSSGDQIQNLITKGYLPEGFATSAAPWGGTITAVPISGDIYLQVTFPNVSTADCLNIQGKLAGNAFVTTVTCPAGTVGNMIVSMDKTL